MGSSFSKALNQIKVKALNIIKASLIYQILKKIINRLSGMKILYKLLFAYMIIGILPLAILSSYMTFTKSRIIMDLHENQVTAENKRVRNILFNIIYLATNISDSILYDSDLVKLLSETYSTEEEVYKAYRNYDTIDSIIKSYAEISSINIFVTKDSLFTSGPFVKVEEPIVSKDWYKNVKDSSGKLIWIYDNSIDIQSSLRLIRKLPIPKSKDYAIISVNISTDYMRFIINSKSINSILSIDNQISFYSNNYSEIGHPLEELYQTDLFKLNEPFTTKYLGEDVLSYSSTLNAPKSKSEFQITTFDPLAYHHIQESNWINLRIILINLLVSLFTITAFSVIFNKSILILRREMNKIANGNLNIIQSFNRHDELGDLFKDMQKTILSIQRLNSRIYEEKLIKQRLLNYQQEMEFHLLSSQINPHFLYNTLETLRMQLSVNKQQEAAHIVKQLGKFMRHNIEVDNSLVLLTSELEYIKIYMEILHFRFGERIKYEINIDYQANISNYMILPLLIQPIVENSVKHGLEGRKIGGTVTINISTNEEYLFISVADNGMGIHKDKLNKLVSSLQEGDKKQKGHIGLYNVLQRIKLFYGERYGISIESALNQFTVITICLPYKVDENAFIRNGGSYNEIYNS